MKKPKTGPRPGPRLYHPKDPKPLSVSVTPFAKKILRAASDRTGKNVSNVVERLARLHGADVDFPEDEVEEELVGAR